MVAAGRLVSSNCDPQRTQPQISNNVFGPIHSIGRTIQSNKHLEYECKLQSLADSRHAKLSSQLSVFSCFALSPRAKTFYLWKDKGLVLPKRKTSRQHQQAMTLGQNEYNQVRLNQAILLRRRNSIASNHSAEPKPYFVSRRSLDFSGSAPCLTMSGKLKLQPDKHISRLWHFAAKPGETQVAQFCNLS